GIFAINLLKKEGYNVNWYIIGDGREKEKLIKLRNKLGLQKEVHFLGKQLNPYNIVSKCTLYLQPSRYEGFCITISEAKSLKKPIITTDFKGASQQVIHGKNGLICAPNATDIYNQIKFFI